MSRDDLTQRMRAALAWLTDESGYATRSQCALCGFRPQTMKALADRGLIEERRIDRATYSFTAWVPTYTKENP